MYNIHVHINRDRALVAKASNEYYAGIITAQKVTGRRVTVFNAWTGKIVYEAEHEGTAHHYRRIKQTIEKCEGERRFEP